MISRVVLARQTLISCEKRGEEREGRVEAEERKKQEVEEGYDKENEQQKQQGSKRVLDSGQQHYLRGGVWISMDAVLRWRLGVLSFPSSALTWGTTFCLLLV